MSKAAPQLSREQETKAMEIHAKAIVVDMCEVSGLRGFDRDYVTRLKEGGVTCSGVCIPNGMAGLSEAISQVAGWYKRAGELGPSNVRLATTVREIREAKDGGWIAAVLNPQGSTFLGYDLTNLEIFAKLGVRVA